MAESNHESVVEYVRACRIPMNMFEISADLENLGNHGADWPRASAQHWKRELEKAIENGELRLDESDCVRLPIAPAKEKQLELF